MTGPPDPFTPAAKPDPYPLYQRLRSEAPVHPLPLPDGTSLWLVTRHDDVERALRDPRLSKRAPHIDQMPEPMHTVLRHQLLAQDPPDHTRLRRLVSQAFTPRLVAGWSRGSSTSPTSCSTSSSPPAASTSSTTTPIPCRSR